MTKVVIREGYYDLRYRAANGQVRSFARVLFTRHDQNETYAYAKLLSAALLTFRVPLD
jgi:hypothetical protein